MKKFLAALCVLLGAAMPAMGEYPEEIAGEQIEGSYEFIITLDEAYNVPYSLPELGRYGFEGNFVSDGQVLVIWFDCAFDLDTGSCFGPAPLEYRNGMLFLWDSSAQSYIEMSAVSGDLVSFEAWTGIPGSLMWTIGCFDVTTGDPYVDFEISEDCPLYIYSGLIYNPVLEHKGWGTLNAD